MWWRLAASSGISNDVELENGRVKHYRLPRNILAFMQVLEYDRSFLASRILFDRFNGSLIISGAFGLFKKDTVIAAGGYDSGTMGEDMELVVKLHEYCTVNNIDYAIRYASGRDLLDAGARAAARSVQAAQALASGPVPEYVQASRHVFQSTGSAR